MDPANYREALREAAADEADKRARLASHSIGCRQGIQMGIAAGGVEK